MPGSDRRDPEQREKFEIQVQLQHNMSYIRVSNTRELVYLCGGLLQLFPEFFAGAYVTHMCFNGN